MKLKPLLDRVVITQKEPKVSTLGGLVLPETTNEKPLSGEIVAIGEGLNSKDEKQKMVVKVGDKVIFSKYAGTEIKLDGNDFIILRQSDILAIIEN